MERHIHITDTTLRDAHQSLWATRMHTADMLPIAEKLDNIGYHSLEVWGGATFDVCLRYLNEDPWERLRQLKKLISKTPLQMLLRGQSLVGYRPYPDDVVEAFISKAVENGINIIRIFDALNDIRNLETAVRSAKKAGAHVQPAIVYTVSPVHNDQKHYLKLALQLVEMGADSICIKDMAGLLAPYQAYDLVKMLKENLNVPLQLHSHYIGGLAVGTYLKAAEAGVDIIDTASVPLAFGASQPPVETVVRALRGSAFDSKLDIHKLFEVAEYFENIRKKWGYKRGSTRISDMRVFDHQVPGGMVTNLITQLEEQKALHRLSEILEEIPRVREDLGYPPLVTPTSQIVGTQAVLNVLAKERYKLVPGEVRDYIQGRYGKPPAPINPEIARKVLGNRQPIICRPADLLEPKMDKIRNEAKELATSEEALISYALFPQVAKDFFETRNKGGQSKQSVTPDGKETKDVKEKAKTMAADKVEKILAAATDIKNYSGNETAREVNELNLQDIKELIKLINETDVNEVKLESEGMKISIKKGSERELSTINHAVEVNETPVTDKTKNETKVIPTMKNEEKKTELHPVISPMVGMFYAATAPDAPPYVKVGDQVKKGQTLCIIEAMKLMNKIDSEIDGEIVEITVKNGEPVEYGQTIFLIKEKK